MRQQNLFRSIAITTGAALIGLAGASAQAHGASAQGHVVAGNYQDHVANNYQDHALPSATRHTVHSHHDHAGANYARFDQMNSRVRVGNYQDHVVPRVRRRNPDRPNARASTASNEGAIPESAKH